MDGAYRPRTGTAKRAIPGRPTRRAWLASAALGWGAAAGAPLAACGRGDGDSAPRPAAQPVTLALWSRLSPTSTIGALVPGWNNGPGAAKKVTLEYTNLPGAEFVDKISAAAAGDALPDIPTVDLILAPLLSERGVYAEITKDFNALPYKARLSQAMVKLGNTGGKQYQTPLTGGPSLLYYNKGLLGQAGVDASKGVATWDILVDFAKRATRAPDQYGIGLGVGSGGTYMYTFLPYVWMNGGDLLSPDGQRVTVDAPEFQQALELWSDLSQKHRATPDETRSATTYDVRAAFIAGKVTMFHTGVGAMNFFKQNAPSNRVRRAADAALSPYQQDQRLHGR